MNDDQPTRSVGEGEPSLADVSSLKGLTRVLGLEPAQPGHDPLLGCDVGGVTIVKLIAEGGMGRVYEGKQDKPSRTVAVKFMRPGLTSPSLLKRFEYEAEVLGRLQHPGIAHIYSVGVHHLGNATVPYFVMEYIADARTLTKYADDLKLPTRQRLDLFRSVCDAVAHGHQKGVIHRDLKPSNILVDATGQPKVIDFGVARATDSDMALTTMQTDVGQLIGTLQYMSPEQFDADPNDIDIRSDVYALGVILYELLAGKPPYDVKKKAVYEVMRIVKEEDPTPLSSLNKALKGDVAVIAGKCLEKDRGQRYSSASELAADVGRYLTGDPISASPPGFVDGLVRLAKKHRAAASAITGIMLSLAVAVVVISVFAIRAERSKTEADRQKTLATEASRKAESARDTAVASRNAAEDLVQFMTFDLRDKLEPIGRLDLMEDVLKKLEAYHDDRIRLEEVHKEQVTGTDLRNRAAFYSGFGSLAKATGDLARARKYYEKSVSIWKLLRKSDPESTRWQYNLALDEDQLGNVAVAMGQTGRAQDHYESANATATALCSRDPGNGEWQQFLSVTHERLGDLAAAKGDRERARQHYEKRLKLVEPLVAQDGANVRWQEALSISHNKLGNFAINLGDAEKARRHWEKALAIMEPLAASEPRDVRRQRDVGACHDRLGVLAIVGGDYQKGREHCEKALVIATALVAQDPKNTQWQLDASLSHSKLGEVASRLGDFVTAQKHHDSAVAIGEALVASDRQNARWSQLLAMVLNKSGDCAIAGGNGAKARSLFEKSLTIVAALSATAPDNCDWQRDLAAVHQRLGDYAEQTGDMQNARQHLEKALRIAEGLIAKDSLNQQWQRDVLMIAMQLGRVSRGIAMQLGRVPTGRENLDKATTCFKKALAVADAAAARQPRNPQVILERGVILDQLGDLAIANDDCEGARDYYKKALATAEKLAALAPKSDQPQANLVISHRKLGDVERAEGSLESARKHYKTSLAIAEAVALQVPSNTQLQRELCISLIRMGLVAKAGEAWGEARDFFIKALGVMERLDVQSRSPATVESLMEILQPLAECHHKAGEDAAAEACEKQVAELQADAK